MSKFWSELAEFIKARREWMLLPLLILFLLLSVVMIFNRDVIHTPFVYSSF